MRFSNLYVLLVAVSFMAVLLFSCSSKPAYQNPHIEIKTRFGVIEAELYPDKAPKSVTQFLANVKAGIYNRSAFYRVLNDENQPSGSGGTAVVQGGVWGLKEDREKGIPFIPHENTRQTGLLHVDGTLSLARKDTGTANTEFFICVGDQNGFDYGGGNNDDGQGYAAFGKVVKGMEIVRRINGLPTEGELLSTRVDIISIEQL